MAIHCAEFMSLQLADEAKSLVLNEVQISALFPAFLLISRLQGLMIPLLERVKEDRLLLLKRTKLVLQGSKFHDGFVAR